MKILTVDIGTGTQDIFVYDPRLDLENGFKLVVPSPTMIIQRRLQAATLKGQAILLHGVIMGGGPSTWAAEAHIQAGYPMFATPQAARTFNDDLDAVRQMGVTVVSDDEAERLPEDVLRLELRDFDFYAIQAALEQFGVALDDLAAVGVAVFDHGDSPPGYSDRQFRFDYLDQRIRQLNRLSAFAYLAEDTPPGMTRLRAVVDSARCSSTSLLDDIPLVVMDTAPAAVLGATYDPVVSSFQRTLIANIGNFHTLAFRLGPTGIEGVFEHHTGLLDLPRLESLLHRLSDGSLQHADVFGDHGHGALIYSPQPFIPAKDQPAVIVTGPRRGLMRNSTLQPYFAVPFGDMMLAGCFGLLASMADLLPELAELLHRSLRGEAHGLPPWEAT